MQLLVSVRSADEVAPALAGGADIIDAKEPSRGSLGAVSRDVLPGILALVPAQCAFSIALGDVTKNEEVRAAIDGLQIGERTAPVYLKLGFAGVDSAARVRMLIDTAVRLAGSICQSLDVIPVAYADAERAQTIEPAALLHLAGQAGTAGVLLDTHRKDGKGLLHWMDPPALRAWVMEARRWRLIAALAGALEPADVAIIRAVGPDVLGVRGAACEGGRLGQISAERVRAVRRGLTVELRETREPAQNYYGSHS